MDLDQVLGMLPATGDAPTFTFEQLTNRQKRRQDRHSHVPLEEVDWVPALDAKHPCTGCVFATQLQTRHPHTPDGEENACTFDDRFDLCSPSFPEEGPQFIAVWKPRLTAEEVERNKPGSYLRMGRNGRNLQKV